MRIQTIIAILFISTMSFHAKGQKQHEFSKLIGSGYILLVEILQKPSDTIHWLGSFRSIEVKVLKDYKGNFRNQSDNIPILIDLMNIHDISAWSNLKKSDKVIVFATGTSLSGPSGWYYATVRDNAIGYRVGSHDRDGFQIGNNIISYRKFKNGIDSVRFREKIENKRSYTLDRYEPSTSWFSGGDRLWAGNHHNSVYADGIYVAHWGSTDQSIRHIYIYKKGRTKVLTGSDEEIVARVRKFLIKQNCNDRELQKCLTEVRFHLENRTKEWASSWGPSQRK